MGWIGEGMRSVVKALGNAGEGTVIMVTMGLVIHLGSQIHRRLAASIDPYGSILKEVRVTKEISGVRCGICSKQLRSAAVSLPCQHVFHRKCIRGSLEHKASCPTCLCPYDFLTSSEY